MKKEYFTAPDVLEGLRDLAERNRQHRARYNRTQTAEAQPQSEKVPQSSQEPREKLRSEVS